MKTIEPNTISTIRLGNIRPNPFTNFGEFPIDRKRIDKIKQSYSKLGFYKVLLVRRKGDYFEVVYGHQRLYALQEFYGNNYKVMCSVKDLTDVEMLKMMAAHNLMDSEKYHEECAKSEKIYSWHNLMKVEQKEI